jgi:hypothetical protein
MLWSAIILSLINLLIPNFDILTVIGVSIWFVAVVMLLAIFYRISRLETIGFKKPKVKFQEEKRPLGIECLDQIIYEAEKATKEEIKIWFPIILAADDSVRPWRLARQFIRKDFDDNHGAIWFTFTRPPSIILQNLDMKDKAAILQKNLVIIDCYSPLTSIIDEKSKISVFQVDPRNPHSLNKKYEEAIKLLEHCTNIRVVYDALSDFLFISDIDMASQYLRHNMCWEEKHNVQSLYLFREGTLDEKLEEYFLWFANTVIYMESVKKKEKCIIQMKTCRLLDKPKEFEIDYNYKLITK